MWGIQSLRWRLIVAATALAVVSVGVVSTVNILIARAAVRDTIAQDAAALAQARAAATADVIAVARRGVEALLPAVDEPDPLPSLQKVARTVGYDTTYIGYADKRTAFSSPQDLPPDYDPTTRPWYQLASRSEGVVLTEPYVDAGTKRLVLTLAAARRDGAQVQAVVAGDIFLDAVQASIDAIKPTPSSNAFIVARDGRLVVHPNLDLILQPAERLTPALAAGALAALDAQPVNATIDGQPRLLVARPIAGTDWRLVIAMHEGEAMAAVRALEINSLVGALVVGALSALVIGVLVHASLRPLRRLDAALEEVASGDSDLTRRLSTSGVREVARISEHFNAFVAKLQSVLVDIRHASTQVHTAAEEISAGNLDLSTRTEHAASSLEETAATMEELTDAVAQTAQHAQQANRRATEVAGAAERGGGVMQAVTTKMANISSTSQRVGEIVNVIDGIAFQTNILALNAAVEAARAGEAGRGFAVVAAEVRALAQRSAQAAKEIKTLIESSVGEVQEGSVLVNDAGAEIARIVEEVKALAAMIRDIAADAEHQQHGIAQIGAAVSALDQTTQQNAALVEQGAAAATALKQQAADLAAAVARFRIDHEAARPALPPR
ncbi:Methyl-accepting chemotaxis protein I [Tepidimonas thermarum]|uniref:Methyl-accepting chemotaxis protein I n=1 Tax=Tepidimonas thermarum TaxID=335431 RepID=A0A554X072_9BURK|nr:methyl-accepting chemotaxis protein [Tepidimonas thermarum]TSE29247.1 Methyl-accepting chemotaxis protein I [Tepidimonas thermarum]